MFFRTMLLSLFAFVSFSLTCVAQGGDDYRVGGGDVLDVKVFGEDELSRTVRVTSDGIISVPLVGKVRVLSMTALEISDRLTELLAKDYLVNPQVTVFVQAYVSKQVQVLGAVKAPGNYNLTGKTTLTALLARAGGLADQSGKTLLVVREAPDNAEPAVPSRIDLHSLLALGQKSLDLELLGGDVVFVPNADEVYVMGEVTQPGAVVFEEGMTLLQAISKVGAFKPTAAPGRIQIIRRVNGKEEILRIDAKRIQDGKDRDQPLQPEDLITVPKSIF